MQLHSYISPIVIVRFNQFSIYKYHLFRIDSTRIKRAYQFSASIETIYCACSYIITCSHIYIACFIIYYKHIDSCCCNTAWSINQE